MCLNIYCAYEIFSHFKIHFLYIFYLYVQSSCAENRCDSLSVQMNTHDELPTIPSDGLLYAAVSFQKHEKSLSDATVRFSKNEIHSDYATISYSMRLN